MKTLILALSIVNCQLSINQDTLSDSLRLQLTRLQAEINAAFALYELQVATCLQAKELIKVRSLETLESNLREIQTVKTLLTTQELSILELQAIRSELQVNLIEVNRLLKKLKRRMVVERIAGSAVIATLTYILLSRPP